MFQEKKFRLQNKFDDLKDKGKRVMENIGERRMDMISKWEEKSRDFIDAFLLLFGREGRLVGNITNAGLFFLLAFYMMIIFVLIFVSLVYTAGTCLSGIKCLLR